MHQTVHSIPFTIAKTWKQPEYPSTGEWMKMCVCGGVMEYYPAMKKDERMPFEAT